MTFSKVRAFVVAAIALVLAVVALSVFTSGERGYLIIVGFAAAAGAVVMAMKAAMLFASEPARKKPAVRLTPGQRLGMIAIGVLAMVFGVTELVTGKSYPGKGPAVTRATQPGPYWQAVALHLGTGGVLFYFALRKPPPLRSASATRRAGGDGKAADRKGNT